MRRIWQNIGVLVCVLCQVRSYGQYALAQVKGTISPAIAGKVMLVRHVHGQGLLCSEAIEPSTGRFVISVPVAEGEFDELVIMREYGRHHNPETGMLLSVPVYVKGKTTCDYHITIGKSGAAFTMGHSTPENDLLYRWHQAVGDTLSGAADMDQAVFASRYTAIGKKVQTLIKNSCCVENPAFARAERAWMEASWQFAPLLLATKEKDDESLEKDKILKPLIEKAVVQLASFDNASILETDYVNKLAGIYDQWLMAKKGDQQIDTAAGTGEAFFRKMKAACEKIHNDTLKGYFIAHMFEAMHPMPADRFADDMSTMTRYLVTDEMRQAYTRKLNEFTKGRNEAADRPGSEVLKKEFTVDESVITQDSGFAYISGRYDADGFRGIQAGLSKPGETGMPGELVSVPLTGRAFFLTLPLSKAGFYDFNCAGLFCRLYLKPGDRLDLNVSHSRGAGPAGTPATFAYTVTKGSGENLVMQEWFNLKLPLSLKGENGKLYLNDTAGQRLFTQNYLKAVADARALKAHINTGNATFDQQMNLQIDADLATAPLLYLETIDGRKPGTMARRLKGEGELPSFIRECAAADTVFRSARLLELGGARTWLDLYSKVKLAALPAAQRRQMSDASRVAFMIGAPANDTLKAVLLSVKLKNQEELGVNNLSEFRNVVEPLRKYTAYRPETLQAYDALYQQFLPDTAIIGHEVKDLSLQDPNGHPVNLRSFKGKVVFFDVWATWCGPCKEQIPYLKEIEEEYASNPNIIFVGLSVDRKADEEKWRTMVKDLNLKGTQLIDYSAGAFARPYGITSVPRFLLLDSNGVWIEIRCPRPMDKEKLKNYLDKALKQVD